MNDETFETSCRFKHLFCLTNPSISSSTPQINTWTSDWIEFYAKHRLGYQLKLARDQYGDSTIYERGNFLLNSSILQYRSIFLVKVMG